MAIGRHLNSGTGETFLNRETIADRCGVCVRSVERAISRLERLGFLHVQRSRRRGRANVYSMALAFEFLASVDGHMTAGTTNTSVGLPARLACHRWSQRQRNALLRWRSAPRSSPFLRCKCDCLSFHLATASSRRRRACRSSLVSLLVITIPESSPAHCGPDHAPG
jgi:hypothetical protein